MSKNLKKYLILSLLFFLPVLFLLFLYPSKHNYNPLDVVNTAVSNVAAFKTETGNPIQLKNKISVVAFLGKKPYNNSISALNLKELIYDNFTGFKGFQVLVLLPNEAKADVKKLKKELEKPDALKYWTFAFAESKDVLSFYSSLKHSFPLDHNLFTDHVFIIDKDKNQRGRLDDRTEVEVTKNAKKYGLTSYNCIEISQIKNKMSDDVRILFTEYRDKRKGNFNSSSRRANDLNTNE